MTYSASFRKIITFGKKKTYVKETDLTMIENFIKDFPFSRIFKTGSDSVYERSITSHLIL